MRSGLALLAGLAAACLAYVANALAVRAWRESAVKWAVPVVEEVSKTGTAVALGLPVLPVHVAFALVECGYDLARGTLAGSFGAILSLLGHTLFGAVTYYGISLSGSVWVGLGLGIPVHMVWNNLAMGSGERGTQRGRKAD